MAVTFNFLARTAEVNGVKKTFEELGIPSNVKSESEAQKYLPSDVVDNFGANQTANATGDVLQLSGSATTSNSTTVSNEDTTTAAQDSKVQALQGQLADLEARKAQNDEKISQTEQKIEALIKKAENKIKEAINKQKEIAEEKKSEAKEITRKEIEKFVTANKNGEEMTRDELSQNIAGALSQISEPFAQSVSALIAADAIVIDIESSVHDLKSLIATGKELESQIADKKVELETAKTAAVETKKCDPIGFKFEDGENYDFIIDDGAFDSTNDFLGAKGNWDAMAKLDCVENGGNGDGTISIDELQKANIKVVNSTGNIFDIAEKFGSDFSINLNSYKEGGAFAGIDTTKDSDNNGVADQTLLGTFSLNINGKEFGGYNTLDDAAWLSNKFGITNANKTTSNTSLTDKQGLSLDQHSTKIGNYEEKIAELKQSIQDEYDNLGFAKEDLEAYYEIVNYESVSTAYSNPFLTQENENKDEQEKDKEKLAA